MSEFGIQLRAEREKGGRTQAEIASLLGTSVPYVSEVERGRKLPFKHAHIMETANFLRCHPGLMLRAAWLERGAVPVEFAGDLVDCADRAIEADRARRGSGQNDDAIDVEVTPSTPR